MSAGPEKLLCETVLKPTAAAIETIRSYIHPKGSLPVTPEASFCPRALAE
ncbi:hypothetical protein ARTHRO9AX_220458 [Arthrobacter sp. 9AX]|nr:hypothetical protein ARTHRO9AX_220458 [Arthrobacter sp. 9AX]